MPSKNPGDARRPRGKTLRKVLWAIVSLSLITLLALEAGYRLVLWEIPTRPAPEDPVGQEAMAYGWRSLGGSGEIELQPLYPWSFGRLISLDALEPAFKGARFIALAHLLNLREAQQIEPAAGLHERMRERALTIWLSRHWTAEQIVAAHYATFVLQAPEPAAEDTREGSNGLVRESREKPTSSGHE